MKHFFKKTIALLTSALFLAGSTTIALSAAPAAQDKKTCTAYIADIEVDGEIDEAWAYAPVIEVTNVKQNASAWYGDSSKVAGKDYATLNCRVLWNGEDTLYVLYEANDKLLARAGMFAWTCDSFELFLNLENTDDGTMEHIQIYADDGVCAGSLLEVPEIGYVAHEDEDLYVLELAVDISDTDFDAGNFIGIDFQYNDDAEGDGNRHVCLGWSDTVDKASSDVSVYGQCELSATTVASLKAAAETEAPATEAPETEAPASTPSAPATADMGIVAATALLAVAAGAVLSAKKR